AFIAPQKDNPNLTVRLHCAVQRIIIKNGRAVGVEYRDKTGALITVHSKGDVILSAGALVSPKILMLSGIGPADHLKQHGIGCHADLPGVGQNLIDHPEVPVTAFANGPYGYFKQGDGWRMIRNGIQLKLFGSGPVTSAGVEAGAFVNPVNRGEPPTIQAFCVPIVYLDRDVLDSVKDDYGVTVTTVVVKPKSRGEVRLASANPDDMPLVSPNLLKHPDDMREMIEGQRFFVKALQENPIAGKLDSIVIPAIDDLSDDALREHCRRFVKTNYHPAGTAKMGADGDKSAVLDARMRVRGIEGLRVCDMSAVPNINAGNTNAPAMMLGDRCADLLMGRL
ncbi:MAG: GMC oxidoreductase, partial [Octadecabacter sp.]|nr:GMC oxidoreductase [Octadecabacter sp.]